MLYEIQEENIDSMKTSFVRKKKLSSVKLDNTELGILLRKVKDIHHDSEDVNYSITFKSGNDSLSFESPEDLEVNFTKIPVRFDEINISAFTNGNHINIDVGNAWPATSTVRASGAQESWCAGAVEEIASFFRSKRSWYSFFNTLPTGFFLTGYALMPVILENIVGLDKWYTNTSSALAYILSVILLGILFISRSYLLPRIKIEGGNKQPFVRKYGAELSLFIAIITLIVTAIGVLQGFKQ